jgi:hypothetical protein
MLEDRRPPQVRGTRLAQLAVKQFTLQAEILHFGNDSRLKSECILLMTNLDPSSNGQGFIVHDLDTNLGRGGGSWSSWCCHNASCRPISSSSRTLGRTTGHCEHGVPLPCFEVAEPFLRETVSDFRGVTLKRCQRAKPRFALGRLPRPVS